MIYLDLECQPKGLNFERIRWLEPLNVAGSEQVNPQRRWVPILDFQVMSRVGLHSHRCGEREFLGRCCL